MHYSVINECRICGGNRLATVLDLGHHPLANGLKPRANDPEDHYPLTLVFCNDCGLVQIRETVDKELLFSQYVWVTGTSSTAKVFSQSFCENCLRMAAVGKDDVVLEIASNDGTFLRPFQERGYRVVGVDPAANIAKIANDAGIETINAFWDVVTAERFIQEYGRAKLLFARNVIAHVSELRAVVAGMVRALTPDGVGAVEFHYAGEILDGLQYDSIYHEHLNYFSIRTFKRLLNALGLFPFHIERSPISGGALVIYFSQQKRPESDHYRQLDREEAHQGINEAGTWEAFGERVREHRQLSIDMLAPYDGRRVVGFGASARSSTYLNFCGFTDTHIRAVIDNNPLKQGMFTPGSSIPIVPFAQGLAMDPEVLFILAWNFTEEIIHSCEQRGFRKDYAIALPRKPYIKRSAGSCL